MKQTLTNEIKQRIQDLRTDEIIELLKVDDNFITQLNKIRTDKEKEFNRWKQKVQIALIENGYINESDEGLDDE